MNKVSSFPTYDDYGGVDNDDGNVDGGGNDGGYRGVDDDDGSVNGGGIDDGYRSVDDVYLLVVLIMVKGQMLVVVMVLMI